MAIKAAKIVVPAVELDKFWVASFNVLSGVVGGAATLNATLIPYNVNGQTGEPIVLNPVDVLEAVQTDPDAAAIYAAVLAYLEKKAIEQGKLIPEEE